MITGFILQSIGCSTFTPVGLSQTEWNRVQNRAPFSMVEQGSQRFDLATNQLSFPLYITVLSLSLCLSLYPTATPTPKPGLPAGGAGAGENHTAARWIIHLLIGYMIWPPTSDLFKSCKIASEIISKMPLVFVSHDVSNVWRNIFAW